jgi:putative hemolysin
VGEQPVTEDEINILIGQGVAVGAFAEEEREIVERVFRTADRRVSQMMTARREITYLDVEDSWEENRAKIAASAHSAFPVCEGGLDTILGRRGAEADLGCRTAAQALDLRRGRRAADVRSGEHARPVDAEDLSERAGRTLRGASGVCGR